MTHDPRSLDRRAFGGRLSTVLSLACTGVLSACATLGLPKRSKAEAAYQDRPNGRQMCSGCVHFEAPNQCSVVAGDISPHGWSRFYLPKPTG